MNYPQWVDAVSSGRYTAIEITEKLKLSCVFSISQLNKLELLNDDSEKDFRAKLDRVSGLKKLASDFSNDQEEVYYLMELIIHGLAACEAIGKDIIDTQMNFSDPLAGMFDDLSSDDE